jgi:hypothetical protein
MLLRFRIEHLGFYPAVPHGWWRNSSSFYLDDDAVFVSSTRFDDARQMLHRVALRRLNAMVGI